MSYTTALRPEIGSTVHRLLLAKALREFSHERLFTPQATNADGTRWEVRLEGGATYAFSARKGALLDWDVDPASITCSTRQELTCEGLVLDAREELQLTDTMLGVYLEELASTFAARCNSLVHGDRGSKDLVRASYTQIEAAMCEGHPGFVATSGRIGWGAQEYDHYAPEMGREVAPVWLAYRRDLGVQATTEHGDELPTPVADHVQQMWQQRAADLGLNAADYELLPLHPWQWEHKVQVTFAPDVTAQRLVFAGVDRDVFAPLQSIRTWYNLSNPQAPQIKMALSVQNMGFTRGLSPKYMEVTPAINDVVYDLAESDPVLVGLGFGVLREYSSTGYTGDIFHASGVRSPYTKMISALWRENPATRVGDGENFFTMAALLHVDHSDVAFIAELVAQSGITATQWFCEYFTAYVTPLLHLLANKRTVFMPHGENIVLRVKDCRVVGTFLKDIGEETVIADDAMPLPQRAERVRIDLTDDDLRLSFFTDMVDGFLRHLARIAHRADVIDEAEFWSILSDVVGTFVSDNPAAERFDFFSDDFPHSCLNRLQLRDAHEMVDITDPAGSLVYAGTLDNPLLLGH